MGGGARSARLDSAAAVCAVRAHDSKAQCRREGGTRGLAQREDELSQESDSLSGEQAWNGPDAERIGLEGDDIEARRRAIQDALKLWPAAIKARAGVIVTINREGDTSIIRGLLREADRKALEASQRKARKETSPPADCEATDTEIERAEPTRPRGELSEALTRRLAAHRTAALQAVLAGNVQVALAALASTLLRRVFAEDYGFDRPAMQISATASAHALLSVADDVKCSRAFQAVEDANAKWRERLPEQRSEWFGWLVELPQGELLDLLGLCAALTINTLPAVNATRDADAIERVVGLDMADWWEPTAEGFLNHVPKAQIVQALKEAGRELARDGVEGMKKDVLVNTAECRLRGTRWLPAALRTTGQLSDGAWPAQVARAFRRLRCGCCLLAPRRPMRLTGPGGVPLLRSMLSHGQVSSGARCSRCRTRVESSWSSSRRWWSFRRRSVWPRPCYATTATTSQRGGGRACSPGCWRSEHC